MERGDREKIWNNGRGWRTNEIIIPFGSGVWRNITKGWNAFDDNITFRVGDGRRASLGVKVVWRFGA